MIKSTMNKGFQMEFENGTLISVQFGYGNYCENKSCDLNMSDYDNNKPPIFESKNAEILIEYNGEAITGEFCDIHNISNDGTVAGWVSPEMVAEAIVWTKNYQPVDPEYKEYLRLKEKYEGSEIQ